ncbi:Actin patches distal protein 1 [Sphaceloma murrayae]|uniref:Actin patches distal protein 1 n=1 Tax=Sphaceloma murrayae TaxID=2082308 RepID=A0A2K1QRZ6_9PEZI|nr:Actin patches distal protein 1 [Sphaceloma murrayae]
MTTTDPPLSQPVRSLFTKRPAWAAPSTTTKATAEDEPEVFTRRTAAPAEILGENEVRRRKDQDRRGKRRSGGDGEEADEEGKHGRERHEVKARERRREEANSAKKRRISEDTYRMYGLESPVKKAEVAEVRHEEGEEEDDDAFVSREIEKKKALRRSASGEGHVVDGERSEGRSMNGHLDRGPDRRPSRDTALTSTVPQDVIALSDDDDDGELYTRSPRRETKKASSPAPDSDDEAPELAALLRERERKRTQQSTNGRAGSERTPESIEPDFDPVLNFLVESDLPGTRAMVFQRKLSQTFGLIRQYWCQRQGFDEEMTKNVFLTWRMLTLQDSTRCRSLGIRLDSEGKIVPERMRGGFRDSEDGTRIHLMAVTKDIYAEMKRRKEVEQRSKYATEEVEEDEEVKEKIEEVVKIRVLLKARGFKDYKLVVRPTTTIEKMANAYRREYKISDDKEVVLKQDGEELEMAEEVQNTEIEDMDCIEVHIK